MNAIETVQAEVAKEIVEQEVKAVTEDAYAGAKKFEDVGKVEVELIKDVLSPEEKQAVQRFHTAFNRAFEELQHAQQVMNSLQFHFSAAVKELSAKYAINPVEHVLDALDGLFKRVEPKV